MVRLVHGGHINLLDVVKPLFYQNVWSANTLMVLFFKCIHVSVCICVCTN